MLATWLRPNEFMSDSRKIEIELNGEKQAVDCDCSIENLLITMGKGNLNAGSPATFGAVAVEVNTEIVPRNEFATTILSSGDEVEIVTLVGGG